MNEKLVIGLDFGSDSVRAVLVDPHGKNIATAVCNYPRWSKGLYSNAELCCFRQHPLDYLEAMTDVVRKVAAGQDVTRICGIGIDTTGSTPCAVNADGVPLALTPGFEENPDAMFVLWKDHTAVKEAEEITNMAKKWHTDYTMYSGGCYSAEWFWAKYLHILRADENVRNACYGFVEHCDWIAAWLTGQKTIKASRCAAGHKAMWHESWGGLPPDDFFAAVDPLLKGRRNTLYSETYTADVPMGTLSREWAETFGLTPDVVVAAGAFDAHIGAVGVGISKGELVKVVGTSCSDMLVADQQNKCIRGICGQVNGSIVPGMIGLEAGQAAFGDIYAWFKRFISYGGDVEIAKLSEDAAKLPESNDIIALDWMNGRRTPDANQYLTGSLFGLNLGTTAPMIFKALVEATAFGAKRIIDRFREEGVEIDQVTAIGGIPLKSPFVMQTCANVFNMPIRVSESDQTCALGAAMFAAVVSGIYENVEQAMTNMKPAYKAEYLPECDKVAFYQKKYLRYCRLSEIMENEIMSNLP